MKRWLIQVDALDDGRTLGDIITHSLRADMFNGANGQLHRDGLDNVIVRTVDLENKENTDEIPE